MRYPPARAWRGFLAMQQDRPHLRGVDGLVFARQLGTGRTAELRGGADLTRWALFATWRDAGALEHFLATSPVAARWREHGEEHCTLELAPLRWHGLWDARDPLAGAQPAGEAGRVAVLTRATLRWRTALSFHAASGAPYRAFLASPGVVAAAWVSEMPFTRFGTFSVWESAEAMKAFSYGQATHLETMRRKRDEGWYSEELFARFAVRRSWGTWDRKAV